MRELLVIDAATVPYAVADEWQRHLHGRRTLGEIPDTVLLLEHPHTYTLGRRFSKEHLTFSDELLRERGIEVHECDRGGSITYHGPGQLVAYPIVDLRRPGREHPDPIQYLRRLEEAIIRTARRFGIVAGRREGLTGVWMGTAKLASIGVKISRGVTRHGLALNVNTDLSYFEGMIPCGIPDCQITAMRDVLQRDLEMSAVKARLTSQLAKIMHTTPVPVSLSDMGLDEGPPDSTVVAFRRAI